MSAITDYLKQIILVDGNIYLASNDKMPWLLPEDDETHIVDDKIPFYRKIIYALSLKNLRYY